MNMRTIILRRLWDAVAPLQPADVSTLDLLDDVVDPRTLCAVLSCREPWTDDTHGWRTCSDHAPMLVR